MKGDDVIGETGKGNGRRGKIPEPGIPDTAMRYLALGGIDWKFSIPID